MTFDKKIDKKFILSTKYKNNEQKRINARIPVDLHGSFTYKDINREFQDFCRINSLSSGGLAFETSAMLSKGDVIAVHFELANTMITELCKITRCHGKEVGCKFINPSSENINLISNYIYHKLFI